MTIQYFILTQLILTALSSGFNAFYFLRYRTAVRRRRVGALTLALLSGAISSESLYFACPAFSGISQGQGWASSFALDPVYWLGVRLTVCLGSLMVSVLILRHLMANRQ